MPHIRPISDLRNTNEISELCHSTNEPVFITKNGYGDLAIMSMETYEELVGERDLLAALAESEEDYRQGKVKDGFEDLEELREKYGLQSCRDEEGERGA